MFISVDGKAKEVKEIFAGGADGKAHKVKELFGSVNGIAKLLYTSNKVQNGFDQFSWAEIKQLANEGKLLEHFNMYDRVTVKLTGVVEKEYSYTKVDSGSRGYVTQKQNTLILQITALTETSMRLSSPYASIFTKYIGQGYHPTGGIEPWTETKTTTEPFSGSSSITITTVDSGHSCYWKFNDVLPEEIKAVATPTAVDVVRKTVTYSSGGSQTTKDTCYIRNIQSPINWSVTTHKEELPYWYEITETQFPRSKSAYLYHWIFPEDCKSINDDPVGMTFLYSTNSNSEYYRHYWITDSPKISYSHTDKYVNPGNGGSYSLPSSASVSSGSSTPAFYGSRLFDFIPEINIEADAE